MKRNLVSLLLLLLFVVGCTSGNDTKDYSNDSYGYETLENVKHVIKKVSFEDLKNKLENKETFYLLIGRPSCSYCEMAMPLYNKEAQNNKISEVFYYDFEEIFSSRGADGRIKDDNLQNEMDFLMQALNFDGSTPTVYYIEKGKVKLVSDEEFMEKYTTWEELIKYFFKDSKKGV